MYTFKICEYTHTYTDKWPNKQTLQGQKREKF